MILDTNAVSAMAEGDQQVARVLLDPSQQYLSVPVLAEYRYGLLHSRLRTKLELWLDECKSFRPVLVLDLRTAHFYAEIRSQLQKKGQMIPVNDLWIAALAMQHQLPILSEDRHFDRIDGVKRIGWK